MRCVTCGYALWNLNQPRCPECGRSFAVTDWDFAPGSVSFACAGCGASLYESSFGMDEVMCSNCDSAVDWSCVRVIPVRPGKGVHRRRSRFFTVPVDEGIVAFLLLVGFIAFSLPALGGRPRQPELPPYAAVLLLTVVVAAMAIALAPRQQRRLGLILWSLVCLAVAGALSHSYLHKLREYEHFCWWGSVVGDLHNIVRCQHEMPTSGRSSHSMIVHLLEVGWLPDDILEMAQAHRSSVGLDDLTVGEWSLQDLADGRAWVEDLRREARSRVDAEWQRFGDYLISSPASWDISKVEATTDDWWSLVVAVSQRSPHFDYRRVCTADGCIDAVRDDDGWIEEQNALRATLDLLPLPDLP
jgi:hypothetical protein